MALRQQKGRNISQKKSSAFLLQILLHAADFGNIQFDGDSNISYNNTKVKEAFYEKHKLGGTWYWRYCK